MTGASHRSRRRPNHVDVANHLSNVRGKASAEGTTSWTFVPTAFRRRGDLKTAHEESIGRASDSVARLVTLHHTPRVLRHRAMVTREGSRRRRMPRQSLASRTGQISGGWGVHTSSCFPILWRLSRSWMLAAALVFVRSTSMPIA